MVTLARDGRLQLVLSGLALGAGLDAYAEEETIPDMAFLEYLGMWEDSDEEWLLLDDDVVDDEDKSRKAEKDLRIDAAVESDASTEKDNES